MHFLSAFVTILYWVLLTSLIQIASCFINKGSNVNPSFKYDSKALVEQKKLTLSEGQIGILSTRNKLRPLYSLIGPGEDLPNLLGINPIEAAAIFGILYYIYGPEELYSYAREAGKFASTYLPVIKDLAVNIYSEFKDYVDEDRERDEMKRRGIDISLFPRRTTNLIERVQESLNMFSEMTKVENPNIGGDAAIGLTPELFKGAEKIETVEGEDSELSTAKQKRKTKRKILESKNIDVKKLIEYETAAAASSQVSEAQVEAELNKSINLVQDRFASITAVNPANLPPTPAPFPLSSSFPQDYDDVDDDDYFFKNSPNTYDQETTFPQQQQQMPQNSFDTVSASSSSSPPAGMTKFQLQMSGMWNQKVLERESAVVDTGVSPASLTAPDWGSPDWEDPLALTSTSYANSDSNSAADSTASSTPLYNEYGMPVMDIPQDLDTSLPRQSVQVTGSSSSIYEPESALASLPTQPFYPYQEVSPSPPLPSSSSSSSSLPTSTEGEIGADIEVSRVLEELDRDYQALRRKLVNVILTVERKASSITATSTSATSNVENTTNTTQTLLAVTAVAKLTDDFALQSVSTNSNSNSDSDSHHDSASPSRKLYWPPLAKRRDR